MLLARLFFQKYNTSVLTKCYNKKASVFYSKTYKEKCQHSIHRTNKMENKTERINWLIHVY